MKTAVIALSVIILAAAALSFRIVGSSPLTIDVNAPGAPSSSPKKSLTSFQSETELKAYLAELKKKVGRRDNGFNSNAAGAVDDTANAPMAAKSASPDGISTKSEESITNNQQAGVDEGGIVKLHGDHLVILRRGRLFTVAVGDDTLRAISAADAFGGEIEPNGTWYDEMLISGNTIAVIGFSYARGGTEVGLFLIDDQGYLSYRSTYHLRSNDYYSSRNYASRLVDGKLVFYTPYYLQLYGDDPVQYFPAVRKWHKGAKETEFHRIMAATRVYNGLRVEETRGQVALHTVTACDIDGGEMSCKATGVIGPAGSVFYVSDKNVYVWATEWSGNGQGSILYKMSLAGLAPAALGVLGSPVDQFSFLESEDGHLNVVVRANAGGTGMWRSEVSSGDVALMRVRTDAFSDGSEAVPESDYRPLPKPEGNTFQNRFVGNYLLYGTGGGWWNTPKDKGSTLYVVHRDSEAITELSLPHGVDRIEALGSDAIVVGAGGSDLNFTSIRLGRRPSVADRKVMKDAAQGELRSHGFFYKPGSDDSGLLGLPVSQAGRTGYGHLFNGSASILFFRNESLHLTAIGNLRSSTKRAGDDHCRASCVDWYGNARPIFARGRIFALLGYEIVEGDVSDGGIREMRRINFSPGSFTPQRQDVDDD